MTCSCNARTVDQHGFCPQCAWKPSSLDPRKSWAPSAPAISVNKWWMWGSLNHPDPSPVYHFPWPWGGASYLEWLRAGCGRGHGVQLPSRCQLRPRGSCKPLVQASLLRRSSWRQKSVRSSKAVWRGGESSDMAKHMVLPSFPGKKCVHEDTGQCVKSLGKPDD